VVILEGGEVVVADRILAPVTNKTEKEKDHPLASLDFVGFYPRTKEEARESAQGMIV
jgi:hypothetical protein